MSWPTTHGMSRAPVYSVWENMLQRCTNPAAPNYSRYGGAGVTVCEEFRDFITWYAAIGPRPAGATQDRIDPTKGYQPGNIRWATPSTQELNKDSGRPYPGVTLDKRRGTYFWRYTRNGKVTMRSGFTDPLMALIKKVSHMQTNRIEISRSDRSALDRHGIPF